MRLTPEERSIYSRFKKEYQFCWECHFRPFKRPIMGMPNKLEAAHVVGGSGRVADRRAIVCLCMMHHKVQENEIVKDADGNRLPPISIGRMASLKKHFDEDNFDLQFIKDLRIKKYQEIILEDLEGDQ